MSMRHNLPHPGPLPKEREDCPPSLAATCDWIRRMVFGKTENVRWLSPLPGGEGQGEGERFTF